MVTVFVKKKIGDNLSSQWVSGKSESENFSQISDQKNHDFFNFEGEGLLVELQLSSFHSPVKWKRGTLMLDR